MSKVCIECGKSRTSGNNVSHSNRKTKRTFGANLHKVGVEVDGKQESRYLCTRCLRTKRKEG